MVFYTIGHSNRSFSDFVLLLREAGATLVADVRTMSRSRANPQFNADALASQLPLEGIGYERFPNLGGLRGKQAERSSQNDYWENASFRNYADYALTDAFREGLEQLRSRGRSQSPAIMCAEAVWWRCHRRIITDYLIAANEKVFHILGPHQIQAASLTPAAHVTRAGVVYPAEHGPPA